MKPKLKCYVCLEPIEGKSDERIIPNCIGGKLKAPLLCKKHNNEFGSKAEGIFAKKMNPFCNILDIKRERNDIPDQPVIYQPTNKVVYMKAGGGLESKNFSYEVIRNGDQVDLHIHAPDTDIRKTRKHLDGLKRIYPGLDVEKTLAELKKDSSHDTHAIKLEIDLTGIEIQQITAKTAVNFFMYHGGDRKYVSKLIASLQTGQKVPVYLSRPTKPVFDNPSGCYLHKLLLIGSKEEKLLYCIVEFFNTLSFVAILNGQYDGKSMHFSYFLDPVEGSEKNIKFRIPNAKEFIPMIKDKEAATENARTRINQFMDEAFQKKNESLKTKRAVKSPTPKV